MNAHKLICFKDLQMGLCPIQTKQLMTSTNNYVFYLGLQARENLDQEPLETLIWRKSNV